MGVNILTGGDDDKLGHVAHCIHQVGVGSMVFGVIWFPEINKNNGERAVKWPQVHKLRDYIMVGVG